MRSSSGSYDPYNRYTPAKICCDVGGDVGGIVYRRCRMQLRELRSQRWR